MKSKKRHQSSSEDSEGSEPSAKSSSSSDSDSEESSESEHRHKKKRKRADSSHSESNSDDQKRSKKRKHKKKKKKHGKRKRRSNSVQSISAAEFSMSDGEISSRKKRKHKHNKHSKRARSTSASGGEERIERRLHSVVKERRATSEEGSQPSRSYYHQRDYRRSVSAEEPQYDREREVQRFYRGSSKERAQQYSQRYEHERERTDKYTSYQDKKYRAKYAQSGPYINSYEEYSQAKNQYYDEYRRHHQRYEERRPHEEHHTRPREDYHPRQDTRGYNNYNRYNQHGNQYEGPKKHFNDNRDYQHRRPPEPDHYREREYQDKRERYHERYTERPREVRPPKPPSVLVRPEKPVPPPREYPPVSTEERYKSRQPEPRDERDDRHRSSARGDARGEERRVRSDERRRERSAAPPPVDIKPRERRSRFAAEDNKEYSWGKTEVKKEESNADDKEKPNFGLSGKLTADANTVNGVVIKYTEPDDAKQPKRRWRFYPFKGDKALPILYIHRQSAFLIGRDKKVVDIMLEHPSISKQHAALQFRATPFARPDGSTGRRVRPYIIDLESANGTFVNNKKVEARRYVELLERDVVKFGFSAREYVLLHENSKDDAQDDDNQEPAVASAPLAEHVRGARRAQQEAAHDGE